MPGRRFRMVSLLGTSPGTPHTTACKLIEEGVEIEDFIIIATIEDYAREAARMLQHCPCPATGRPPATRAPEVRILPFMDVDSLERLGELRRAIADLLDENAILDITGGRKLMAVGAVLEALPRGTAIVATVLPDHLYQQLRMARDICGKTAPHHAKLIVLRG